MRNKSISWSVVTSSHMWPSKESVAPFCSISGQKVSHWHQVFKCSPLSGLQGLMGNLWRRGSLETLGSSRFRWGQKYPLTKLTSSRMFPQQSTSGDQEGKAEASKTNRGEVGWTPLKFKHLILSWFCSWLRGQVISYFIQISSAPSREKARVLL